MRRSAALLLLAAAGSLAGAATPSSPVKLKKLDLALPGEERFFEGPAADTLNTNCTACHSAEMVLTQPSLSAHQWQATVKKMREIYKAPIAEEDDAAIVQALTTLSRE